jgi:hypothetical protein
VIKSWKKFIILEMKKNETYNNATINSKIKQLELTLGLLDADFHYLNKPHPTNDEKAKSSQAIEALTKHWRDISFSITLKAHVMEQHIVVYNNKYGVGNKEESFTEQGHQIGMKENWRYHGVTNFQKKGSLLEGSNNCYTSISN